METTIKNAVPQPDATPGSTPDRESAGQTATKQAEETQLEETEKDDNKEQNTQTKSESKSENGEPQQAGGGQGGYSSDPEKEQVEQENEEMHKERDEDELKKDSDQKAATTKETPEALLNLKDDLQAARSAAGNNSKPFEDKKAA